MRINRFIGTTLVMLASAAFLTGCGTGSGTRGASIVAPTPTAMSPELKAPIRASTLPPRSALPPTAAPGMAMPTTIPATAALIVPAGSGYSSSSDGSGADGDGGGGPVAAMPVTGGGGASTPIYPPFPLTEGIPSSTPAPEASRPIALVTAGVPPMTTGIAGLPTLPPAPSATALPTGTVSNPATLPPAGTAVALVSTRPAATPTAIPADAVVPAIKAGEIDDNRLWKEYLSYRERSAGLMQMVHNLDITERHVITVTDTEGIAVLGARVRIYLQNSDQLIHESYTYANGQTLFFPRALVGVDNSVDVVIDKGTVQKKFVLTRAEKTDWRVSLELEKTQRQSTKVDVLFLFDTTGSMDDELQQLQANILSVSRQIDALPSQPNVRYGLVAYRDRGDEYITHVDPFTGDVKTFQARLNALQAGGGGDYPESVNAALHDAIYGMEWRGEDTVKLIFLIGDAPPHLDYSDDFDYAVDMRAATKKGIKIYSLAASGLTDQGEYIFRQMAQYTMGHFIFITYQQPAQANGQNPVDSRPGENTNLNVPKDDYQVELLDKLVVRLVRQEIGALSSQPVSLDH